MIEISLVDILLFAWATGATAYAFKYKEEAHMHKYVIHKMLTDDKVRADLVDSFQQTFREMKP
jgi:hypothetical protein